MPTRGKTVKQDSEEALVLSRPMVVRRSELTVDHETCCGCEICATVCPREAITLSEPEVGENRLVQKPRVDIDPTLCNFCGECVILCPTRALSIAIDGEPQIPVLEADAFPRLIRKVEVNQPPCEATTDVSYIDNCPSGAISADIEEDEEGNVISVRNVEVDRDLCFACTRCMEEGPEGAFRITKPYKGSAYVDLSRDPSAYQACADICPTNAITCNEKEFVLDERFCIYCGACEKVSPVEDDIRIVRTGFEHTPVESGAWTAALEKLVSFKEVAREFEVKGQQKRRRLVFEALLLGIEPD